MDALISVAPHLGASILYVVLLAWLADRTPDRPVAVSALAIIAAGTVLIRACWTLATAPF